MIHPVTYTKKINTYSSISLSILVMKFAILISKENNFDTVDK